MLISLLVFVFITTFFFYFDCWNGWVSFYTWRKYKIFSINFVLFANCLKTDDKFYKRFCARSIRIIFNWVFVRSSSISISNPILNLQRSLTLDASVCCSLIICDSKVLEWNEREKKLKWTDILGNFFWSITWIELCCQHSFRLISFNTKKTFFPHFYCKNSILKYLKNT